MKKCTYCKGKIYKTEDMYVCNGCGASVKVNLNTGDPYGLLADDELKSLHLWLISRLRPYWGEEKKIQEVLVFVMSYDDGYGIIIDDNRGTILIEDFFTGELILTSETETISRKTKTLLWISKLVGRDSVLKDIYWLTKEETIKLISIIASLEA